MKTDNRRWQEFPPFKADTPPIEYSGRSGITTCSPGPFRIHIPNSKIIQMIRQLIIITSLTELHESTLASIYQRSAGLRGMRLEASVFPPMHTPDNCSHTRFGNTTSVVLSGTLFIHTSIINQQTIRAVRHLTDKHTRRTCRTDSGMTTISLYCDIVSRHIGTIDNGSGFTHTCKFHTSHP